MKQPGQGTDANDRPPILHSISRATGEERCPLVGQSDKATGHGILAEAVPTDGMIVSSDEEWSYHGNAALVTATCVSPAVICPLCWPPKQPPHDDWT